MNFYGYRKNLPAQRYGAAAAAGLRARQDSLAAGHPVVYADHLGRNVKDMPDGTRFEVRFEPGESHLHIVRELPAGPD